ncbi:glycosyltransferase family 4 protein [Spongiivirga citrea]|uniref:Glycosyltransferase n=1 Tax=Spongiivirga citrea TaxID=1481457 RepID=A0A6M0CFL1_9FLAO|nr:glycosyltransferase family 4 protein [Spongiivirga citrea]NER16232.1 glycosyltransferase [Spongiivirga citrea]
MKKLLIIGFVFPEPASTAAGSRMLQLIQLFIEDKWDITFATAADSSGFEFNLEQLGVTIKKIVLNDSSFDLFISALQPTAVMFDRFMIEEQFGWRVAEHCPDALRILDTEDLHFLRQGREVAFKNETVAEKRDLLNDHFKREVAAMYRCDLSLIISSFEYYLLINKFDFPSYLLHYIPFFQDSISATRQQELPSFDDRTGFVTVGNFLHPPNLDSVVYLKEVVWPLIRRKIPDIVINIYGAYGYEKVQRLHNKKEGFLIQGRAEAVSNIMSKARVCLSPLRFGAGLKGKFIDAMNNGTPIVTTKIGAEGMSINDNWPGYVSDDPKEIATKAALLYNDKAEWKRAQKIGFSTINDHFSKSKYQMAFVDRLNELLLNLRQHREKNTVGQLLTHHQLQSTKYMAKWIEEKNK